MASKHTLRTIGDVCYVTDGAHAKVHRQDKGVLYLTSKNIGVGQLLLDQVDFISHEDYERLFSNTTRAQRRPVPGDVLTGIIGTFGNAYLYRENDHFGISSAVALLRADRKQLVSKYLYYVITSNVFRNAHYAYKSGSVQGYTNIPTIKRLPIPIPPLPEQRAIAHILGTLDDKIELNRRMNETLEAMAQAIFKNWFVDFEPFRDQGMEESPLGPIPRGWRVASIGESVLVVGGSTPSTKERSYWENGEIHWATPKDLASLTSSVLLETERCITEQGLQQISSGLLPKGTVLLSSRAPVGYLAIAEIPLAINQGFIAMVCNRELPNHFVLRWAQTNTEVFRGRANGTTFPEISKTNFRPIQMVIPPMDIVQKFTDQAQVIHQQVVNNLRQARTLISMRDALLPKLLSGEIRVKDAEMFLESRL